MYKNFSEYWENKKEILERLGVAKAEAKMIWDDAINSLGFELVLKELGKLNKDI